MRLLDFGFALSLRSSLQRMTAQGVTLGTLAYLAPEQTVAGGDIGTATNVWAA